MVKLILAEEGMSEALEGKILISICAGVTMSQLKSWVPSSTIVVRAMPNTPSKVSHFLTVNHAQTDGRWEQV
jgi:pyrroline-5-carboxylate reductase